MRDDAPAAGSPAGASGGAADEPVTRDDRLAAVFTRARTNVARRVRALQAMTDTLRGGHPDEALRAAVVYEAHTLAGTAGTFGLDRISELASDLEQLLDGPPGGDPDGRRAGHLVRQMADVLAAGEPEGG